MGVQVMFTTEWWLGFTTGLALVLGVLFIYALASMRKGG